MPSSGPQGLLVTGLLWMLLVQFLYDYTNWDGFDDHSW